MMTEPSQSPERTEVLVVGAGPVGLFAGLCAARRGLGTLVLDHVWRGYGRGHATLLHPKVLRVLAEYGLAEELAAEGQRLERILVHIDGVHAATIELPSPALSIAQTSLEKVLLAALAKQGVEVRAPHQAAAIEQHLDHVNVRIMRRELVTLGSPAHYSEWEPTEPSALQSKFVIGADGYDSRMRSALGIRTAELASLESFAMFETPGSGTREPSARLQFNEGLGSMCYPLPAGKSRWAFQIHESLDAPADLERLEQLVAQRAPARMDGSDRVDWGTVVHFERRLAREFGKGRVWLAGDAAHVTSPLGNQSMNVGLLEVRDLVQRMFEARDTKQLGPLQLYAAERQREWHKLLGVNVSFELLPHAPAWLSAYARHLVPTLPASGEDLTAILETLGLRLS
jgi:2-polyprenyl-6-methoxyphenol hydroxylase-like FAD-dependent oxidoreductase